MRSGWTPFFYKHQKRNPRPLTHALHAHFILVLVAVLSPPSEELKSKDLYFVANFHAPLHWAVYGRRATQCQTGSRPVPKPWSGLQAISSHETHQSRTNPQQIVTGHWAGQISPPHPPRPLVDIPSCGFTAGLGIVALRHVEVLDPPPPSTRASMTKEAHSRPQRGGGGLRSGDGCRITCPSHPHDVRVLVMNVPPAFSNTSAKLAGAPPMVPPVQTSGLAHVHRIRRRSPFLNPNPQILGDRTAPAVGCKCCTVNRPLEGLAGIRQQKMKRSKVACAVRCKSPGLNVFYVCA